MAATALIDPIAIEAGFARAFEAVGAPDGARSQAWENFAARGIPHRRVEEWKWTDLRRALTGFGDAEAPSGGGFTPSRAPDARSPLDGAPRMAMPALAGALAPAADVFNLARDGESLALDFCAAPGASHQIIGVTVEPGVSVTVEERYRGAPASFANVAILYTLGEGARLTRVVSQSASPGAVLVSTGAAEMGAGAIFEQTTLSFGAALARLETHVAHAGEGASARLDGVYLLKDDLHTDQTSVVDHQAPDCTTRQLVKGIVGDRARGVFQGKFHVARTAQRTDARMGHHALILNDGATANAKPELEIYADDVQCAHGNTAGALDDAALFYMRARGLPEARARALLMRAFVEEALAGLADGEIKSRLETEIARWLEAGP